MHQQIIELLRRARFNLSTEALLKREMAHLMAKHLGIILAEEYSLDPKNRLDFFLSGIAIEVKINKGSAKSIYKQCERYCQFPEVQILILVTNRAMGFPPELNGKPCYIVSLGKGWL